MVKRLSSLRLQFLVIAISLAVITTVLGLSAYITERREYNAAFHTATGTELGFSITGEPLNNELVYPGDPILINAAANVEGDIPLYVFIEVDIPADCTKNGFNSTGWQPITEGSNLFYYGNYGTLYPLGGEDNGTSADILTSLTLSEEAKSNQNYEFSITGYAIQAYKFEDLASQPRTVYQELLTGLENSSMP